MGGFQCALGCAIGAGREDARPIGEGSEGFNPQVYPGFLSRRGKRLYGKIGARDGDVPAIRFMADRDGLGCARQRARPAHGAAPDLGQDEHAVIQPGTVAVLLEGEGMGAIAPRATRKARLVSALDATEKRLLRPVDPRQHVLQDMAVHGGILRQLRPDGL